MLVRILLILALLIGCGNVVFAQFTRFENIKPMISTREDVEKLYGTGKRDDWVGETSYLYDEETVEITYSDGKCTGNSVTTSYKWLAPKDTVIVVYVSFIENRKLSELKKKVKLKKLQITHAYDMAGEKRYHDDENGVNFYVDIFDKTWHSVTYYPSAKYSQSRCEN